MASCGVDTTSCSLGSSNDVAFIFLVLIKLDGAVLFSVNADVDTT